MADSFAALWEFLKIKAPLPPDSLSPIERLRVLAEEDTTGAWKLARSDVPPLEDALLGWMLSNDGTYRPDGTPGPWEAVGQHVAFVEPMSNRWRCL